MIIRFFDADGSVTLNSNNGQLAITLTQKTSEILQPLLDIYGGSIYIDRTSNNLNDISLIKKVL